MEGKGRGVDGGLGDTHRTIFKGGRGEEKAARFRPSRRYLTIVQALMSGDLSWRHDKVMAMRQGHGDATL